MTAVCDSKSSLLTEITEETQSDRKHKLPLSVNIDFQKKLNHSETEESDFDPGAWL